MPLLYIFAVWSGADDHWWSVRVRPRLP